jgi:hypothetical protein
MNLAFLGFDEDVPLIVRFNAIRIALRISQQQEAMDFDMDPRGILSSEIKNAIHYNVFHEKQFIAGHELSHYLCNHLKNTKKQKIYTLKDKYNYETVYEKSHKQEYEADLASITRPNYSKEEKGHLFHSAILFLASLDLVEYFNSLINPVQLGYKAHPAASERLERIITAAEKENLLLEDSINELKKTLKYYKDLIKDDVDNNYEIYDFYGSLYLDEPNTKWRGKKLKDRIDY